MNIQLTNALAGLLGERFTTSEHKRQQHVRDESALRPMIPEAVCYPLGTEKVAVVVRLCWQHQTPSSLLEQAVLWRAKSLHHTAGCR